MMGVLGGMEMKPDTRRAIGSILKYRRVLQRAQTEKLPSPTARALRIQS